MSEKQHELEKVKWGVIPIVNYRGCYVSKNLKTGLYSIWDRYEVTAEGVDRIIDESLLSLMESTKRG